MMRRVLRFTITGLASAILLGVPAAHAAEPTGGDAAPSEQDREAEIRARVQANTAAASALLEESASFLASQQKFAFEARTGFDVVQANGQPLAFFETRKSLVRRPDHLRVEIDEADGDERIFRYDGKLVSIELPGENAYVAVEKPGTIDEMVAYFVEDLGLPVPLHDFYTTNFFGDAKDAILSGFYVDEVTLDGRQCHHLAFRLKEVDVQVWVEDGERPLPCSLVISFKHEPGQPQYWAQFVDWDLSPRAGDGKFEFSPPEGAERLSIQSAVNEIREDTGAK
jgi:hypothetical protein